MKLESVLVGAVLLIIAWLPLPLGSNRPWSIGLFVGAIGLITLLWGWLLIKNTTQRRWKPVKAGAAMIAFLACIQLWVALQLVLGISTNPSVTIDYLARGLAYTGLFILLLGLFRTRQRVTLLLSVLIITGVAQAFFGAFLVLADFEWVQSFQGRSRVVSGTFVNRNHAAGYLAMMLSCGIGLLLALRDDRIFRWHHFAGLLIGPKAWLRLSLIIMVIALVMTQSRMGNVAFFSSLLIVGALFTALTPVNRVRNILVLVSILAIDALIVSQWFGLEELQSRLVETRFQDEVVEGVVVRRENVIRDNIVSYAIPQFKERPWLGYGAGTFETSFQRFPGSDVTRRWDHAHNDYLQIAIEFGLIGALLFAVFVLLALWHGVHAMAKSKSRYRGGVGTGATMGIVALLIHSSTDFNLQIPANAALFVTLCALTVLARTHRSD